MRVRYSREQWTQWLSEYAASGLSATAFCKQRELPLQSFYNWRAKFANATEHSSIKPLFVPLSIRATSQLEVEMPCGAKLRVPPDHIQAVLIALHQLGARS